MAAIAGRAQAGAPCRYRPCRGTEDYEFIEAAAGTVGDRLHLHWQLRLRAERLGAGWFIVEQQAYADTGEDGRLAWLDLLCTGYRSEAGHD